MSALPVFLIGFMASGKSSKGKRLAKKLGLTFVDLDREIEKEEGVSVSSIFESRGEEHFRKLESKALRKYKSDDRKLIALGGGTVCHSDNMTYVKSNGTSIYLKLSNEMLLGRLRQKRSKRPLIAHLNDAALKAFINSKMEERGTVYEQADYIVDANNVNLEDLENLINS